MGIRVHKVIGYGLTDLKFKRGKHGSKTMVDPRINWGRLHDRMEEMHDTGGGAFLSWAEENWKDLLKLEAEERHRPLADVESFSSICPFLMKDFFQRHKGWSVGDCVVHQDEFGLANVLLLIPPMQAYNGDGGWKRYDDTIDWIEESFLRRTRNRVVRLQCSGLYPYDGFVVRFRDPKPGIWPAAERKDGPSVKLDANGLPNWMLAREYNMLVGRWDPGRVPPMVEGELLEHLKGDWRPEIPSELLALMWWMRDCFNDFAVVRDGLRPLLYVYWS
jgi:hypothetical protein